MPEGQTEVTSLLSAEPEAPDAAPETPKPEAPPAAEPKPAPEAKPEGKVDEKPAEKGEDKPAEKPAEKTEALELTLPEGIAFEPDSLESFKAIAAEAKLPKEVAQRIVDGHVAALQKSAEKANALFEAEQKAWQESLRADAEIGGDSFAENIGHANRAVTKFGGKELGALFRESGLGNHPALVRAFVKIGKAMKEDSVAGNRASTSSTAAGDPLVSLYTTLSKE